ncbi:UNVERIFIED_CONTAM: Metastasis-associated protein mta2 [Gekko kuhli]
MYRVGDYVYFENSSSNPYLVRRIEELNKTANGNVEAKVFESLPVTHIRGKCSVTLLNETDVLSQYLDKEDCFFYSLVFDPVQKTLLADQGEIRVGCKYQAEIPDCLAEGESDNRN